MSIQYERDYNSKWNQLSIQSMALYTVIAVFLAASFLIIHKYVTTRQKLPPGTRLPPGPKGLPWIGRVHDIPSEKAWMKFAEWAEEYGPIYQQTMMGVNHVWVSKEHMVLDLLAKNGAICSDRPAAFPNVPGTKDWKYLPLQGFHDTWKRQRKFTHHIFGVAHDAGYWSYSDIELSRLLVGILESPFDWSSKLDQFQARFLSRCAFGTPRHASSLSTNAWRLLVNISPAGRPSNVLPGAMRLPKWIAWWRVDEQDRQTREEKLYAEAQAEICQMAAEGKAPPSFTRIYHEQGNRFQFPSEIEAAFNVGMVSMAGIHTTSSPLHTFFLAMTLHPEWLAILQNEIDAVCNDRPPTISDFPNLPTLRAVLKECIRWRPAVPTGIPHQLDDDVVYKGYFIPKGSWIHPLEWSLSRDATVYPDPDIFKPDRWLNPKYPTYKEPLTKFPTIHGYHQFGFGRRVCQGVNIVETQCCMAMGAIVWAFNIKKARYQRTGLEMPVEEYDYHALLITKPNPFQLDLIPRSEDRQIQVMKNFARMQEKDAAIMGEDTCGDESALCRSM